jgi:hypothetical protein
VRRNSASVTELTRKPIIEVLLNVGLHELASELVDGAVTGERRCVLYRIGGLLRSLRSTKLGA